MFKPRRYTDITEQEETAGKVRAHAPLVAELSARGFQPFCVMEAGPHAPMYWSVVVDEAGRTAASVLIGARSGPALYLVTRLVDGTVIETQWRPNLPILLELGPSVWMDDRSTRAIRSFTPRTVDDVIAKHARVLQSHATIPHDPWTVASYLRFRRQSWRLIEGNRAVREFVAIWFLVASGLSTLALLAVRRPAWPIWLAAFAAFAIFGPYAVWRVGIWIGGVVSRFVPIAARERLAARMDAAGWDDN